jgi:hypothetical protein
MLTFLFMLYIQSYNQIYIRIQINNINLMSYKVQNINIEYVVVGQMCVLMKQHKLVILF